MKNFAILILSISFLFLSCKSTFYYKKSKLKGIKQDSLQIFWQYLDLETDSIPGISLHKIYRDDEFVISVPKKIIVAILDSEIDIYNNEFKNSIWTNPAEIPSNQIDDDHNGYVDDVHGWNFWGNADGETSTYYTPYEYVRIFKKLDPIFKHKERHQISSDSLHLYNQYTQSRDLYEAEYAYQKNTYPEYIKHLEKSYVTQRDTIQKLFPQMKFDLEHLKSLQSDDAFIQKKLKNLIYYLESDIEEVLVDYKNTNENHFIYYLNLNYNDRLAIGDEVDNFEDRKYGHPIIFNDSLSPKHATKVSGIIANISQYMSNDQIQIMPLVTIVNGDPHDKDIALAIRYAVDNGASVINMSFGKQMSIHNEWVMDAIKYAEEKDVLIVKSAGNDGKDITDIKDFPNDVNDENMEVFTNFITVGSTQKNIKEGLLSKFSNYSSTQVDLFAPGEGILVSIPHNAYKIDSGTSLSTPIVTGIAALIKSYYPHLTALQIKEILMASGTPIDLDVEITDANGQPQLVPFASLSKSGKIVNAYNALRLAQQYKKWKKGKWTLEKNLIK
jgi:cell wall-associated protease